jgi:hypothetical protein
MLLNCRLLSIDGHAVMTVAQGPAYPGAANDKLPVDGNPEAVAFMEWSNSFARFQQARPARVLRVRRSATSERNRIGMAATRRRHSGVADCRP